ncbi:hypothetical protein OROGR_006598 [Orobanche gracilis]
MYISMFLKMAYRIEEKLRFHQANRAVDRRHHQNQRRKPSKSFLMFIHVDNVKAILLMVLFTVSLLVLPLILPPLPPPPMMFLLIPVAIMVMLVFLAVTPPQLPNVAFIDP